jgi:hypothetical protein
MTADQWIAAVIAIVTGVAVRVIDHYWPDLGERRPARHKDTSPGSTPSSESGEV